MPFSNPLPYPVASSVVTTLSNFIDMSIHKEQSNTLEDLVIGVEGGLALYPGQNCIPNSYADGYLTIYSDWGCDGEDRLTLTPSHICRFLHNKSSTCRNDSLLDRVFNSQGKLKHHNNGCLIQQQSPAGAVPWEELSAAQVPEEMQWGHGVKSFGEFYPMLCGPYQFPGLNASSNLRRDNSSYFCLRSDHCYTISFKTDYLIWEGSRNSHDGTLDYIGDYLKAGWPLYNSSEEEASVERLFQLVPHLAAQTGSMVSFLRRQKLNLDQDSRIQWPDPNQLEREAYEEEEEEGLEMPKEDQDPLESQLQPNEHPFFGLQTQKEKRKKLEGMKKEIAVGKFNLIKAWGKLEAWLMAGKPKKTSMGRKDFYPGINCSASYLENFWGQDSGYIQVAGSEFLHAVSDGKEVVLWRAADLDCPFTSFSAHFKIADLLATFPDFALRVNAACKYFG